MTAVLSWMTVSLLLLSSDCDARPKSSEEYGSWGSFSGFGGSIGGSASANLGGNYGVGFSNSNAGGGSNYGLNLFGNSNAALAGSGNLNLGFYQGGYRHPVGGNGGGPGGVFGGQPQPPQSQPGFGFNQPQQPGLNNSPPASNGLETPPQQPALFGGPEVDTASNTGGSSDSSSREIFEDGAGLFDLRQRQTAQSGEHDASDEFDASAEQEEQPKPSKRRRFFHKIRNFFRG